MDNNNDTPAPWSEGDERAARDLVLSADWRKDDLALLVRAAVLAERARVAGELAGERQPSSGGDPTWAVGQLRHLYRLLMGGHVLSQQEAARGLLGPAIEALEPLTTAANDPATRTLAAVKVDHG